MAMNYLNGDTFKESAFTSVTFHIKYENLKVLTELTF